MTQRVNASTAAADVSASWQPAGTGDIVIQVGNNADMSDLVVQLEAQQDATAPWAAVEAWRPASTPFLSVIHFKSVRVSWRGNKGTLNIWDGE